MSERFVKVPIDKLSNEDITDSEFRLWCAIRSFGDFSTGNNCFPSLDSIAERSGNKSRSSVIRGIKGLVSKCHLIMRKGTKGRSNAYFFAQPSIVSFLTPPECHIRHHDSVISDTLPDTYQEPFTNVQTFSPNPVSVRDVMLSSWRMAVTGLGTTAMAVASA